MHQLFLIFIDEFYLLFANDANATVYANKLSENLSEQVS